MQEEFEAQGAPQRPKKSFFREWVLPFAIEVAVILLLVKFVFFFVRVPSGSMIPTIDEQSWLFATHVYEPEHLDRGDIVVFWNEEYQETFIKRLIALPGDVVDIEADGTVLINGEPTDEPYVVHQLEGYTGHFEVPQEHYFFLGDNRAGSNDARFWSEPYIPAEAIKGQARFTLLPFKNFGVLR